MYLKSIEVHGFKSFANKILFEFHNGITGIVGPNGSGKSNVADAVRWVLGEQSAKQLRGASMQDIIFAGTENRKPLSYAYVAITMDNSDSVLPVEYKEVTVARRVYRSGESEYLINGTPCRLKDVNELFYDTGIGKEGYSIIGQGQIDRILNGKPEERRELFDEAAGIVKYKRRKATAQKKLQEERDNLVRVNDILSELERQVGPLEKQAEKAKIFLKKKEDLKNYDVNMFLLEVEHIEKQLEEVNQNYHIADNNMKEQNEFFDNIKKEYEEMEKELEVLDETLEKSREEMSHTGILKEKLEGQIRLLQEQIKTSEMSEEHFKARVEAIDKDKEGRTAEKEKQLKEKEALDTELSKLSQKRENTENTLKSIQAEIARCNEGIEKGKNEIIELLNKKASMKASQQKFDTLLEQVQIRKAELNQRLLKRKGEEADLKVVLTEYEEAYGKEKARIKELTEKKAEMDRSIVDWEKKRREAQDKLQKDYEIYHKEESRLEALQNIAERYDGYGNSIRKVMEKKDDEPGILGVVADLIQVDKKYETAVETALGGNIQNIVTEDENTAKKMVRYLKENRFGRATFLPLTSVKGREQTKNEGFLSEEGVIGFVNTLVHADEKYDGVLSYLLGRVFAVDTIDHALALAKKSHYSLHIVTLEGEYLSPGGSIAGGAFRNNSNLLGRNREMEDLKKKLQEKQAQITETADRIEEIQTAVQLLREDVQQVTEELQNAYLQQNTAKINLDQVKEKWEASETLFEGLQQESAELDAQIADIHKEKEASTGEISASEQREEEIQKESKEFQKILDEQMYLEEGAAREVSEVQMDEANFRQKIEFALQNIGRVDEEIAKLEEERNNLFTQMNTSKEDIEKKRSDIEEIKKTILASDDNSTVLTEKIRQTTEKKEELQATYKGFFQRREDVSKAINDLDKEIYRLNNQREKLEERKEYQTNYMWNEYELTLHHAEELRNPEFTDLSALKKMIAGIKDDIRKLGDVNVNAIEDFKETNERYQFLKGQHDDLIESEKTLLSVIEDLDTGMRKQFTEKFEVIQKEFDKAFKELFGGGRGTLELVEEEDILECGIRIIAHPPGKKLQNMMQLSGGEKALTAIALLFAIQNMKPSPFCLLDEIEAALDDSNVSRFAKYLHKLTKNTQFIIITHRRGTMAAADRLYGITMQEKGVSTLVSVNLIEDSLTK